MTGAHILLTGDPAGEVSDLLLPVGLSDSVLGRGGTQTLPTGIHVEVHEQIPAPGVS